MVLRVNHYHRFNWMGSSEKLNNVYKTIWNVKRMNRRGDDMGQAKNRSRTESPKPHPTLTIRRLLPSHLTIVLPHTFILSAHHALHYSIVRTRINCIRWFDAWRSWRHYGVSIYTRRRLLKIQMSPQRMRMRMAAVVVSLIRVRSWFVPPPPPSPPRLIAIVIVVGMILPPVGCSNRIDSHRSNNFGMRPIKNWSIKNIKRTYYRWYNNRKRH